MQHDAITAARVARRRLCTMMSPGLSSLTEAAGNKPPPLRPSFTPQQVERMLRVEATHKAFADMLSEQDAEDMFEIVAHVQERRPGPFRIENIDWYIVEVLPDPGWRVIDPLEPKP